MSFWLQRLSDPALLSWVYLQKKSTQPLKSQSLRAHFLSKHFSSFLTLWRQPHIFPKRPKWPTSVKFSLLCQTTQGYLEQPETISYLTFFIRLCVRNMLKLLQIWSKPIKCNKEYFSSLVPNIFSNPPLPFRQI